MAIPEPRDSSEPSRLRFGVYELDAHSGELRREGAVIHLPPQPFKVLWLLTRRAGEVVTREEIREELWGDDTFVDFDGGLNFCINQIRRALRDSAESPRFVHTLPRRGYRFIAPVEAAGGPAAPAPEERPEAPAEDGRGRARILEIETGRALPTARRRRLERLRRALASQASVLAAVAALAVLAALGALALRRPAAPPAPEYSRITFRRGAVTEARLAPDGDVLYSAAWDGHPAELFSARPGRYDAQPLGLKSAALVGALASGDVAAIAYHEDRPAVLVRMGSGSAPREVLERVREADWAREDEAAAVLRKGMVDHLEFPLGHEIYTTATSFVRDPRVSRDGARVAFLEHPSAADDRGDVVMVDRGGKRTVLSAGWASLDGVAWSPDGREVWFTGTRAGNDSMLNAVDLSGRERVVLRGPGRMILHDAAPDGRVLLQRTVHYQDARVRVPGKSTDLDLSWQNLSLVSGLAADGSAIVINGSGEGNSPGYDVFYRKVDGSPPVRIGEGRSLDVSPDGRWVLSIPLNPPARILALPTGAGSPLVLATGLTGHAAASWFPDSRRIAFVAAEADRGPRLFVQDLDGGTARAVSDEGIGPWRPVVSNDGSLVVVRTGGPEGRWVAVPLSGGSPVPVTGVDGRLDRVIRWTADGQALFVQRGSGDSSSLYRVEYPSGARRHWTSIDLPERAGVFRIGTVMMTADGASLAYTVERVFSELYVVTGVR